MTTRAQRPPRSEFDAFSCPLVGLTQVEASAGTGKTHALTALYLRLLLEMAPGRNEPLTVPEILVVTYTRAATEELRGRVRKALRSAKDAFAGVPGPKKLARDLLVHRKMAGADPGSDARVIERALLEVDEAAIFTIHGFCDKVLRDHAFEAATPFEAELLSDTSGVTATVVDDYLRRALFPAPFFLASLARKTLTREILRSLSAAHGRNPDLEVRPEGPAEDPQEVAKALEGARAGLERELRARRPALEPFLAASPRLHHTSFKRNTVPRWLGQLEALLAGDDPLAECASLENLRPEKARQAVKDGGGLEQEEFFQALAGFLAAREGCRRWALTLKADFLQWFRGETGLRLGQRGERGFDDLLQNLLDALTGPTGDALAASIAKKFPVALIDEFQDTDPVQARIFEKAYSAPGASLFLVGDPKQSIYAFRGADLQAYFRTEDLTDRTLTLATNHRSQPRLVRAVNALFQGRPQDPFLNRRLVFEPVKDDPAILPLDLAGAPDHSPFRLWFLARKGEEAVINKGSAERDIVGAAADEVVSLLRAGREGRILIPSREEGEPPRPLGSQDIALLVPTRHQGRLLRKALADRGVKTVFRRKESVFASPEAGDLLRVLAAVAEPGNELLVRGALATPLLGRTGEELAALAVGGAAMDRELERFRGWRQEWEKKGLVRLARLFLADQAPVARLLAHPDGERSATNLLHLLELCRQASAQEHAGVDGLVKWLARRIASSDRGSEEGELRLESDEGLVTIATVHASKGLQWPVVFCPFAWAELRDRQVKADPFFHDPARGGRAVLDLGSEGLESAQTAAWREALAENLRLMYVSLTRASHRCYATWGAINTCDLSGMNWLLHGRVGDLPGKVGFPPDAEIEETLKKLVQASEGAILVEPLPLPRGPARADDGAGNALPLREPILRVLDFVPAQDWEVTSFSGLEHGREAHPGGDEPLRVDWPRPGDAVPAPVPGLASLPRGRAVGTALHEILQRLPYDPAGRRSPDALELVRERLAAHRLQGADPRQVLAGLDHLLSAPLAPGGIVLGQIPPGDRVAEMPFFFDRGAFAASDWARAFRAHGGTPGAAIAARLERLPRRALAGLLTGSIDLVFRHRGRYHLVDWKSNDLGGDYSPARVEAAMNDGLYVLQAHLYAVALHRHLRRTLPGYSWDREFGGAFFLFVRGVSSSAGAGQGVWHARPSLALIEELDAAMGRSA